MVTYAHNISTSLYVKNTYNLYCDFFIACCPLVDSNPNPNSRRLNRPLFYFHHIPGTSYMYDKTGTVG